MKKLSFLMATVLALSLVLTACGGGNADKPSDKPEESKEPEKQEQLYVRIATQMAETNNTTVTMKKFADYIMEKDPSIKVEVFPNAQLGAEDIVMQQVLAGTLECAPISGAVLSNVVPEIGIFNFPFLFKNLETYIATCWDEGFREKIFNAVMDQTGCKALGFTAGIGRGVANTKHEVRTPADLKGMKIRTIGSPIVIDTFKAFGATATSVPWREVYTALSQGLVDGEDSSVIANLDQKFIEVNKFYTQLNYIYQNHILLVSPTLWGKLTDAQKQLFIDAGVYADEYGFECSRNDLKESYARAAKEYPDFKITNDLTDEERGQFIDAARPVWDKYMDNVGKDLFDFTFELTQKLGAEN